MKIGAIKGVTVFLLCTAVAVISPALRAETPVIPSLEGLPEVTTFELPSKLKLLTIKDELPRSVIICTIGFGKMYEDSANAGISELMAKEISIAGTKKYQGNDLSSRLEAAGGSIGITAGWENITVEINVLARDTELAFDILGDILLNPVFSDEALNYSKSLVMENFRREMDDPSNAGFTKVREIIFNGKGYGSTLSGKSIGQVKTGDLDILWKRITAGGNICIAVSSSVEGGKLKSIAEARLSAVKTGDREYYTAENDTLLRELNSKSRNIYLLPKELEQATIITGTIAPEIKYDGNYSLFLMNYILGGGSFNSRLMNEIRVKRGLAYSVFSLVRNRYRTGVFMSFAQTRNEEVTNVISLMQSNINKMSEEEVTAEELAWARESVTNSYVFNFARTSDILDNYLQIEYNNLDREYYRDYLKNISKVTPGDIKRESGLLFRNGIVTVVVGSRKLEESLKKYGNVVIVE